ncbi:MAG: TetR/AcrR family transcriptional regulator [Clostridia bacterium]|nr:TetR/AcrR family transcriptional regulator [Clostridia bacterium]
MKKGELRKESILKTAERLFFERGYDETSIQDILDALSISKGGFYHYFESKIALLEEICRLRSARDIDRIRMELFSGKFTPVQKLNLLLGALNLFAREDPEFSALVLKISYIDGDVHFREQTRVYMLDHLRPMVDEVIREGIADGSFFSRNPGQLARIILMLGYDVNDEVCRILAANAENPDCVIEIMDILNAYRDCVENLCGAKFGSISLFDVEQLMAAFRQTAKQIGLLKE